MKKILKQRKEVFAVCFFALVFSITSSAYAAPGIRTHRAGDALKNSVGETKIKQIIRSQFNEERLDTDQSNNEHSFNKKSNDLCSAAYTVAGENPEIALNKIKEEISVKEGKIKIQKEENNNEIKNNKIQDSVYILKHDDIPLGEEDDDEDDE